MAIAFRCQCGSQFNVKPEYAGKIVKCPNCQGLIQIPMATSQPVAQPGLVQYPQQPHEFPAANPTGQMFGNPLNQAPGFPGGANFPTGYGLPGGAIQQNQNKGFPVMLVLGIGGGLGLLVLFAVGVVLVFVFAADKKDNGQAAANRNVPSTSVPSITSPNQPAGQTAGSDSWSVEELDSIGFHISFPRKPDVNLVGSNPGATCITDDGLIYMCFRSTVSLNSTAAELLQGSIQAAKVLGTVEDEKIITLEGADAGIEYVEKKRGEIHHHRHFIQGNYLYRLDAATMPRSQRQPELEKKFLESFKLVGTGR